MQWCEHEREAHGGGFVNTKRSLPISMETEPRHLALAQHTLFNFENCSAYYRNNIVSFSTNREILPQNLLIMVNPVQSVTDAHLILPCPPDGLDNRLQPPCPLTTPQLPSYHLFKKQNKTPKKGC